ncbi:hypothetical protein A6M27_05850 [Acidithiobacillus thiooxidans]|uniref:Uncharacterized protein n=1 Tax=Acidithiobacillus thiooxidans TaxID=930 RepID=A0A1C2IGG0_ACITH|nr:hypothetical protein [Acidithiobacillus thiooxidans]MDA8151286.1 hypothetical protein [Acidithiobacillus sp.]MBU2837707.1 hypothetical protein [Acidithiobacillus thiooxidans]OCX75059.1 hypothetical protein A6P07_04710 [Acidithiobacillus thiooxidans]OCX77734.1 hypothetical protein A6O24_06220 [Acidithiobacillus thiooxidans]OCX85364.1 hypothetical protein A6O26_01345 [Acidithiobacillus thiooxidans]
MRSIKLSKMLFNGLFHVALVASVDKQSHYLLVDGLRELVAGLNELIDLNDIPATCNNEEVLEHDILDIEHVVFLMLEDARAKDNNLELQCSLSQLMDELTAIKWFLSNRSQVNNSIMRASKKLPISVVHDKIQPFERNGI